MSANSPDIPEEATDPAGESEGQTGSPAAAKPGALVDDATAREMELRARLAREGQPPRGRAPAERGPRGGREERRGERHEPRPPREHPEPRPQREHREHREHPEQHAAPREAAEHREPPLPREPAPRRDIDAAIAEALDAIEKLKGALGDLEYILELLEDLQVQQHADARQIEQLRQQVLSMTGGREHGRAERGERTERGRGGHDRGRRRDDERSADRPAESPTAREEVESGGPPAESGRNLAD